MKKYIIITFIILIVLIFGVIVLNNKKTGYYTYGKSCKIQSDCKCEGIAGTADICGKPGQLPACINGKCGFAIDNLLK